MVYEPKNLANGVVFVVRELRSILNAAGLGRMCHSLGADEETVLGRFARFRTEMWAALLPVLITLQANERDLRRYGVCHAAIFGSVARGEGREDSDIDVLIDLEPQVQLGLFDYARLKLYIAELLGRRTDVVNRKTLKRLLIDSILRDAVNAF